jgi:hypothetical protein
MVTQIPPPFPSPEGTAFAALPQYRPFGTGRVVGHSSYQSSIPSGLKINVL